jgi:sulfate/thiosulfate transport system substrate-binding protein
MHLHHHHISKIFVISLIVIVLAGCTPAAQIPVTGELTTPEASQAAGSGEQVKITLGAYTTPREAYQELIPIFQAMWKEKTGQDVVFEESYQSSGAQSRAIVEGFEADIAALSLEADVQRIQTAGLITQDWKSKPYKGMVSTSVVSFAVRKGNPEAIHDWADLAKPSIEVLTPNPKTSGGAMWNILALYGAAKHGMVAGVPADDDQAAAEFLRAVLGNVIVMDKGARESIINFEKGVGDAAITYENEVLVGQQNGQEYELVIPRSTILIENPVAIVDAYVDKHGNREVVEAFVDFLFSRQAQEIFAAHGLRSPDPAVAAATAGQYPPIENLFSIDYFGGWGEVTPAFFGDQGTYTVTVSGIQNLSQ